MVSISKTIEKIKYYLFLLYIYVFGIGLPLYYNDQYFDMMSAKASYAEVVLKIMIIPLILLFIYQLTIKRKEKKNPIIYILILFGITCTISTLLSRDINNSIFGHEGWYVGLLVIKSVVLASVDFYDIKIKDKKIFIPLLVCIFIINLIAILHSFEIDALGLHSRSIYRKFTIAISTLRISSSTNVPSSFFLFLQKFRCFYL